MKRDRLIVRVSSNTRCIAILAAVNLLFGILCLCAGQDGYRAFSRWRVAAEGETTPYVWGVEAIVASGIFLCTALFNFFLYLVARSAAAVLAESKGCGCRVGE